jgi:dTDP-D-glucose 4,6-dehydratase
MVNPNINPAFGVVADRPLEQVRVADAARSASLIGWRALTTLEQGLRNTTEWYRGQITSKLNAMIT